MKDIEKRWTEHARKHFVGRKIVGARYLSQEEADDMGWYKRPIVLQLDNGSLFYPSMDDEGNNGGTLFGQDSKGNGIDCPVL